MSTKKAAVKLLIGLAAVLVVLWTSGCHFDNLFHERVNGSGVIIQVTRSVGTFNSIECNGSFEVYFSQGPQSLILEGDDNILPLIKTLTRGDGTLVIDSEDSYSSHHGIRVYASMQEIRGLYIVGSGKFESEAPFHSHDLDLSVSGSGSMWLDTTATHVSSSIAGSGSLHLNGRTGSHHISIAGSGNIRARDFQTSTCRIDTAGSGNATVYVNDTLDVTIAGSGSVYYKGNPTVLQVTISGSGRLVKLD